MAKSTRRAEIERGIVLDEDGFPVAFVQWEKGQRPNFNQKLADGSTKRHKVIDGALYKSGAESGRWNGQAWEYPDAEEIWVNEKGQYRKRQRVFSQHMNRAPALPPGWTIAGSPPPKSRSRRAVYDKFDGQWKFPKVKVVLADDGTVINRVLVDPREGIKPPPLPPGQRMIDEPPGATIKRGSRYNGRSFVPKGPPK